MHETAVYTECTCAARLAACDDFRWSFFLPVRGPDPTADAGRCASTRGARGTRLATGGEQVQARHGAMWLGHSVARTPREGDRVPMVVSVTVVKRYVAAAVLGAAVLAAAPAGAQNQPGARLRGTVVDSQNAAIAGAAVDIVCGAERRRTSTNGTGQFAQSGLPQGACTVTATTPRFEPLTEADHTEELRTSPAPNQDVRGARQSNRAGDSMSRCSSQAPGRRRIEPRRESARTKEKARLLRDGPKIIPGSDLLSHTPTHAVPSAVAGLTSVFGMGTGGTLPL